MSCRQEMREIRTPLVAQGIIGTLSVEENMRHPVPWSEESMLAAKAGGLSTGSGVRTEI